MSDYCFDAAHGDVVEPKSVCPWCLRERIAELEWEYASVVNQSHDELKHNTKLEAENQRLRKVLASYADPKNWGDDDWGVPAVNVLEYRHSGKAARKALLGSGEK